MSRFPRKSRFKIVWNRSRKTSRMETTSGYRANDMKFDSVLYDMSDTPVVLCVFRTQVIKRSSGEMVRTGNPFDVAIKRRGWLAVATRQVKATRATAACA